jgi:HEPN domain-containing protein
MEPIESQIDRFVTESFRDVADKDYIAARICWRHGLHHQFLWLAEQAIEKYLKAILLYNRVDTRALQHNLRKCFDTVLAIPGIDFDFPDEVREFVEFLDDNGNNRYLEHPYALKEHSGLELDQAVWFIRRYCKYLRNTIAGPDGTERSLLEAWVAYAQSPRILESPNKFQLLDNGYLERVLDDKKSSLRRELVWKNFYYGTYTKRVISEVPSLGLVGAPQHFLHPEVFDALRKLVYFPKSVVRCFNQRSNGGEQG